MPHKRSIAVNVDSRERAARVEALRTKARQLQARARTARQRARALIEISGDLSRREEQRERMRCAARERSAEHQKDCDEHAPPPSVCADFA
jgi:hypothetical protein